MSGYATCKRAMGLDFNHKGSIITMDPLRLDHLWLNTELAKYISYYEKPSTDEDLCEIILCKQPYDFIFLDSEHDYGTITYEIAKLRPQRSGQEHLLHSQAEIQTPLESGGSAVAGPTPAHAAPIPAMRFFIPNPCLLNY